MKNESTHVIPLLVLYDNRKSIIFKVLGVVVYFFLDKYFFIDHLCIQKGKKLYVSHGLSEETLFDDLSVNGIPEVILNIVSCFGFIQEFASTIILTCMSKLVSYYLFKRFVMLLHDYQALDNVPIRAK